MSSMRNAVLRRPHRERAQPKEREKWGLLEKHKDYSARARDFNEKKTKLRALRQKRMDKNPDEFYFGMMSKQGPSTTRTGTVSASRGNQALSQDAVRLFKTQDLGYIRTLRNQVKKEVDELETSVAGIRGTGKKIVFVDGVEDQWRRLGNNVGILDDDNNKNDLGLESSKEPNMGMGPKTLQKMQQKEKKKLEARLEIARERLKNLTDAEEALDLQRARMSKSPTVGGITKTGQKFRVRERKR